MPTYHLSVFHDGHAITTLHVLCWILPSGEEHSCYDVGSVGIESTDGPCGGTRSRRVGGDSESRGVQGWEIIKFLIQNDV